MQMIDQIANSIGSVAAICGGIITILALLGQIRKWLKKILNESKAIRTDIDKLKDHAKENYMSTLRLTIMNEEIPLEERLEAGEKYVQLGGNGPVKCKYKELQETYLKKSRREE